VFRRQQARGEGSGSSMVLHDGLEENAMSVKNCLLATLALLLVTATWLPAQDAAMPKVVYLWPNGAPGFEDRKDEKEHHERWYATNIHNPSLLVYLPPKEKATGAAVILCPGGGHRTLNYLPEGVDIAKWLNSNGIAGLVLKYRMANDQDSKLPRYKLPDHPLQDAQRAVRLVRHHARQWDIDPDRVGMMGFSAGGQVTVWATTRFDAGNPEATDPVEKLSCRPDFQVLVYSGPPGSPTLTKDVPPAFIAIGEKDSQAIAMANYFIALKRAGISTELLIYPGIDHAFGLGDRRGNTSLSLAGWPTRLKEWMVDRGILKKP
jgi:acetyl esterase/lipase